MTKGPFTLWAPAIGGLFLDFFWKDIIRNHASKFTLLFRFLKNFEKSINVLLIDPNKNRGPTPVLKVCSPGQ